MSVQISSRLTFFAKFLFPALWGGLWSFMTGKLFTDPASVHFYWQIFFFRFGGGPAPSWAKWFFVAALFAGSLVFARVAVPLKDVALEDGTLLISNFVRTVRVPLADVTAGGFEPELTVNGKALVELRFRSETGFGRSIEFLPGSRDALELLRARLGPEIGGDRSIEPDEPSEPPEFWGRGTV